jgi:beta-lactamase superfamily II metal-dependent hydrolase
MSASVTVRMYNQLNLGDCFLLKFEDKGAESFLLIDFGSYESGNDKREKEIADHIKATVGDKPLTIVLTHQHKDHLTGFISAKSVFDELTISELWLSYLDDPTGPEAIALRKVTEKFWKKNKENKELAKKKFGKEKKVKDMLKAKDAFDLFAEEQKGGEAITNLLAWCKNNKRFLLPGENFSIPGLPDESVKVYVLGPPTDEKLLRKLDPGKGEAVHSLNASMQLMNISTSTKLMEDGLKTVLNSNYAENGADDFPFNKKFMYPLDYKHPLKEIYFNKKDDWRRIDHEWLSEMGRVSLHMDRLTNNSSLVLAFELVKSGKVLLFVGDAQIGNWKSWFDIKFKNATVDARDLLSRTVLYKAGHHSSHNATLLEGLNLMKEDELVIMIPVNGEVSQKMGFAMLRPGMLMGYNRKSNGRVLRSDTVFHKPDSTNLFKFPFAKNKKDFKPAITVTDDKAKTNHLFVEYVVK